LVHIFISYKVAKLLQKKLINIFYKKIVYVISQHDILFKFQYVFVAAFEGSASHKVS